MAASQSSDFLKGVDKLEIHPDGRSAVNWTPYAKQLLNVLAGRQQHDYFLDDVVLGSADGAPPPKPEDVAEDQRDAASTAYRLWIRTDKVAQSYILGTLPSELKEAVAQQPTSADMWRYLTSRFAGETISSIASLFGNLFQLRQ